MGEVACYSWEESVWYWAMGSKTVQFSCHHCLHCCTDVVCLPTPWDVIRIVKSTGEDPEDFLEFLRPSEITGVAKNDPTWLRCNKKKFIMALQRDTKKGCYFLDRKKRQCSIYEARPILCRLYPFKLQENKKGKFKGFTLHKDVGCPRNRDGVIDTKPLHDLYLADSEHQDDYADLVHVFNKQDHPERDPYEFVDMFVSKGAARR